MQFTKMEKKLEKAQQHSEQQRNVIMQLKAQKCDMDLIKVQSLNHFYIYHVLIGKFLRLRLRDTLYYRKSKLNLNYAKEKFLR